MLTETEKRNFVLKSIKPMASFTLPFLTQVIGVVDEQQGEYRGTGLFCMIGGRQAVVTAAHVLREAAATGRYRSLAFNRGWGETPGIVAGTIRYFDALDLAIYLPDRDFPIGADKAFWPEDRIERDVVRVKTDYLFVQGVPDRFARVSTLLGGLVSETLSSGAMMRLSPRDFEGGPPGMSLDPDVLPEGLLKDHEFAFDFSFNDETFEGPDGSTSLSVAKHWREIFAPGERQTLPGQSPKGAFGLSGSPVWRIGGSDRPIRDWSPPASKLVGIVTNWNPVHQILIATSASKLIEVSTEL